MQTDFESDYSKYISELTYRWGIPMSPPPVETDGRTFMLMVMNVDDDLYNRHTDDWELLMGIYWATKGL